jgi:3-oxoacyl-(acyl-carrier-protein) synthase
MRRVVVTGYGIVSSLGNSIDAAFECLKTPRNCVEASQALKGYKGLQSCLWAPSHFEKPPEYTRKVIRTMSPVSV